MKIQTLVSPPLAVAVAWLLLATPEAPAFKLTGESLRVTDRDVRVHDNFTDLAANSNTTPHPSFPGYVGAELAIWKGCIEWSSEPHFEGQGDPTQPYDLGSGGSNFDLTWQGLADDPGGLDDNIHSELGGSGAGVIAFTETPTSDGWRIRYYRNPWTFFDNPNNAPSGNQNYDLQGIACHEYGHALGLNHSNVGNATMFSTSFFNAGDWRSIEDDDRAGIQAIYGVRDPTKPRVDTYAHLAGGALSVRGSQFHPTQNEVWFTQAGSGGDGTPIKVQGLASLSGGTEILLQVPASAGPGDLLVKLPGGQFPTLSNAFPFDLALDPCPDPIPYGTGKLNSSNGVATIGWIGFPTASANSFKLSVTDGPAGEWGLVFWGMGKKATPFYGGWMLNTAPHFRGRRFTLNAFGYATAAVPITPSMVGQTRYYQCWYRDLLAPEKAGTTNGLEVTFCD
jgi:hypothetical protein